MRKKRSSGVVSFLQSNRETTTLLLPVLGTILILAWLFGYSHYGLDFTDEGYYLVWIANPFAYDWGTSQFGAVYHPAYRLFGGNIALLRQFNILLTFALGWALSYVVLEKTSPGDNRRRSIILASAFGTASLVVFDSWLPTPSYNSLCLQSLLLVAIGLGLTIGDSMRERTAGYALASVGGWLALMAKPSSAAVLAIAVPIYLVGAKRFNLKLTALAVGLAGTLSALSAWVLDGSVVRFIARLNLGAEYSKLSGAGYSLHDLLRLDTVPLNPREKNLIIGMALFVVLLSYALGSPQLWRRRMGMALAGLLFLPIPIVIRGGLTEWLVSRAFWGLYLAAIPLAGWSIYLLCSRKSFWFSLPRSQFCLALLLSLFPAIYAFGTNANYWQAGGGATVFWVVMALFALGPTKPKGLGEGALLAGALATQVIVVLSIGSGMESPYRQTQPLRLNNSVVSVGGPGSTLYLSEAAASYINTAKLLARKAGLEEGVPLIDLTGQSPTILYALRAQSLGYPWIAGGYSGSSQVAKAAIMRVSCAEIARAWILLEVNGPRAVPTAVLANFGAVVEQHYRLAASWDTAGRAGGANEQRHQQLFRPTRSVVAAAEACEISKRRSP